MARAAASISLRFLSRAWARSLLKSCTICTISEPATSPNASARSLNLGERSTRECYTIPAGLHVHNNNNT
jgi:hypothetical protein